MASSLSRDRNHTKPCQYFPTNASETCACVLRDPSPQPTLSSNMTTTARKRQAQDRQSSPCNSWDWLVPLPNPNHTARPGRPRVAPSCPSTRSRNVGPRPLAAPRMRRAQLASLSSKATDGENTHHQTRALILGGSKTPGRDSDQHAVCQDLCVCSWVKQSLRECRSCQRCSDPPAMAIRKQNHPDR